VCNHRAASIASFEAARRSRAVPCHSRASGNLATQSWTPACAGVTMGIEAVFADPAMDPRLRGGDASGVALQGPVVIPSRHHVIPAQAGIHFALILQFPSKRCRRVQACPSPKDRACSSQCICSGTSLWTAACGFQGRLHRHGPQGSQGAQDRRARVRQTTVGEIPRRAVAPQRVPPRASFQSANRPSDQDFPSSGPHGQGNGFAAGSYVAHQGSG